MKCHLRKGFYNVFWISRVDKEDTEPPHLMVDNYKTMEKVISEMKTHTGWRIAAVFKDGKQIYDQYDFKGLC